MNQSESRAWIFLDKQEFKLFKEGISIPEIEYDLAQCKPDSDGDFGLYLTFDQLDKAHKQASLLVDDSPTRKQRELWDKIWVQLGNALDEAAFEAEEQRRGI